MDRAPGPKTALLGRIRDRAAGVGFVAVHGPVAMVHALVVPPEFRRQGVAAWLMRRAGHFATGHGAPRVALAVTRANAGALALYDRLGFVEVGRLRAVGHKHGRWLDTVQMQRALGPGADQPPAEEVK